MRSFRDDRLKSLGFGSPGISLVEILVGLVVLTVTLGATISIFNSATKLAQGANTNNQRQAAIDDDLDAIRSLTERYACSITTGSTTASCSVLPVDDTGGLPVKIVASDTSGRNTYISQTLSSAANLSALRTLCGWNTADPSSAATSPPIISSFITAVNGLARPTSFTRLGITRIDAQALANPSASSFDNKSVRITWNDSSGTAIYSSIVTPPASRWCP